MRKEAPRQGHIHVQVLTCSGQNFGYFKVGVSDNNWVWFCYAEERKRFVVQSVVRIK